MISVVDLYNMSVQVPKKGTSGYFSIPEWNANLKRTQTEVIEFLAPFYEINQQITDALAPFIKKATGTSDGSGILAKPDDYVHLTSLDVADYPCYPISVNQRSTIKTSPVRKPSVSTNQYYRIFQDNSIQLLPETALEINYTYIRKPAEASVSATSVSSEDSDYQTITAVTDLEWPHQLFNLFLYLMLEKMGIEVKEQILIEYGNLGVQKEAIKV